MFSELICNLLGHFWVYSAYLLPPPLSVCPFVFVGMCVSLSFISPSLAYTKARALHLLPVRLRETFRAATNCQIWWTHRQVKGKSLRPPNITYRVLISTLYNRLKHTSSKIEKSRVFPRGSDWKAEFTSKHLFWAVIACSNKQPDNHVGRKFKLSFFRFKILSANSYQVWRSRCFCSETVQRKT